MSIKFQASNDTFFRTILPGVASVHSPVTVLSWVKILATGQEGKTYIGQGSNDANSIDINRDYNNKMIGKTTSTGAAGSVASSPDSAVLVNEWVLVAYRRSSSSVASLYTGRAGEASVTSAADANVQNAFPIADLRVSLGSGDVQLAGGQDISSSILVAEFATYDVVMSDAELDTIKEGANPGSFSANLVGLWATDAADLGGSMVDQSANSNDLMLYKVDGTAGAGAVPALYDADHPPVAAVATVSATLVQDANGSPYANRLDLHYALYSGGTVDALTLISSGIDGRTDANGVMVLGGGGASVGDKLILNVFSTTAADIHAADTTVLIGSVQVQ